MEALLVIIRYLLQYFFGTSIDTITTLFTKCFINTYFCLHLPSIYRKMYLLSRKKNKTNPSPGISLKRDIWGDTCGEILGDGSLFILPFHISLGLPPLLGNLLTPQEKKRTVPIYIYSVLTTTLPFFITYFTKFVVKR